MKSNRVMSLLLLVAALGSAAVEARPASRLLIRFEAGVVGEPVSDPRCAAPMVLVELEGSGRSNVLGAIDVEASHCIIDDPSDPGINDGVMTIMAEEGTLSLSYSGTDDGGDLSGVFIITGGTGAYAGATGEGTFTGIADSATNTGSVLMRGRITLP